MLIRHPRPDLGRQTEFGIEFVDGVAHVSHLHPERLLALRQHGFTVEDEPIVNLNALTIPQLRDLAQRNGVEIPASVRLKPDIVALVAGIPAEPIPGSEPHPDGGFLAPDSGVVMSIADGPEYFIPAGTNQRAAEILSELATDPGEATDDAPPEE